MIRLIRRRAGEDKYCGHDGTRADRSIAVPLLSLLCTHHLQYSIYSKCNIGFNGTIPARRQSPINREFRIRKLVGVRYVLCIYSQGVATTNRDIPCKRRGAPISSNIPMVRAGQHEACRGHCHRTTPALLVTPSAQQK